MDLLHAQRLQEKSAHIKEESGGSLVGDPSMLKLIKEE